MTGSREGSGFLTRGDMLPATRENIEQILTTLALCNGNAAEARRRLKEVGLSTSDKTIARIRDRYPDLYRQRRAELAPAIEEGLAADLLENAAEATATVRSLIAETRRRLEEGTLEEPARAARELSQVTTQSVDKRLAIQGRPTQITEVRDVAEIIRALEGKGIVSVIESTAIEQEPDD